MSNHAHVNVCSLTAYAHASSADEGGLHGGAAGGGPAGVVYLKCQKIHVRVTSGQAISKWCAGGVVECAGGSQVWAVNVSNGVRGCARRFTAGAAAPDH